MRRLLIKLFYLHLGKVVLRCFGLWVWDGNSCHFLVTGEVLRVARRPGHHHRQREIQSSRVPLPAIIPGHGNRRPARNNLQLDHEVRHRHPKGPVRQQCVVGRQHHVPGHCRPHAEGDHGFGARHHEDQDHRAAREEVLRVDRRLHLGLAVHFSVHVDHQAGVWRVGAEHRSQKVLLKRSGDVVVVVVVCFSSFLYLVCLKEYGFEVGQFKVRIYTLKIEQKLFYILFVMHSQFNE